MPQLVEARAALQLPVGGELAWQAELGTLALRLRCTGAGASPEVAMLEADWEGPYEARHLRAGQDLGDEDLETTPAGGLILPFHTGGKDELRFDPDGPSTHSVTVNATWQAGGLAIALHEQAIRY